MALQEERRTRPYLYGRLLAVAERLEEMALYVAGESRETTASRLMQRFAGRPFSTWRTIELSLVPYRARLRSRREGLLVRLDQLIDQVMKSFPAEGVDRFDNDAALSGEFLLAYHCQREVLRHSSVKKETNEDNEDTTDKGEE